MGSFSMVYDYMEGVKAFKRTDTGSLYLVLATLPNGLRVSLSPKIEKGSGGTLIGYRMRFDNGTSEVVAFNPTSLVSSTYSKVPKMVNKGGYCSFNARTKSPKLANMEDLNAALEKMGFEKALTEVLGEMFNQEPAVLAARGKFVPAFMTALRETSGLKAKTDIPEPVFDKTATVIDLMAFKAAKESESDFDDDQELGADSGEDDEGPYEIY